MKRLILNNRTILYTVNTQTCTCDVLVIFKTRRECHCTKKRLKKYMLDGSIQRSYVLGVRQKNRSRFYKKPIWLLIIMRYIWQRHRAIASVVLILRADVAFVFAWRLIATKIYVKRQHNLQEPKSALNIRVQIINYIYIGSNYRYLSFKYKIVAAR